MQYVDRGTEPPPQTLLGSVPKLLRKTLCDFMEQRDERRAQSSPPTGSLNFTQGGMQQSLERLFNGRCAFCESAGQTEYYQFRPIGEAQPYKKSEYAHLYYCWLELAWQNFYAVCGSCRPSEAAYFPVNGGRAEVPHHDLFFRYSEQDNGLWPPDSYPPRESPLLLDPCEDRDFQRHIWIGLEGDLQGASRRGSITINHFNLNRPVLVEARRKANMHHLGRIRNTLQYKSVNEMPEDLFKFEGLEFGGTWYLLLRRLAAIMAAETGVHLSLSRRDIKKTFLRLCIRSDGFHLFNKCELRLERVLSPPPAEPRIPARRPSQAQLVAVEIENFRSIEHLRFEIPAPSDPAEGGKRTPALVILGENATGKSSILEAITMALASSEANLALGIPDRQLILSPDHFGEFDVSPPPSASISLQLLEEGKLLTRNMELGISFSNQRTAKSEDAIPVFAYGAFRKYGMRSPVGSASKHIRNLFDASDLPNPEKWLLDLSEERFAMVTRALRTVFSIEGEFDVILRDQSERRCLLVSDVDEQGRPLSATPLQTASSGFRSVLAMTCDVMQGMMNRRFNPKFESLHTSRGVVLIDEIESHLHPRWKIAIVSALRQALPNVTFIVTTHDPLCLRGMDDNEVIVLRRARLKSGRTARGMRSRVEILKDVPAVSCFRIEQLLTSDLFQLNSTDDPAVEARMSEISSLLASTDVTDAQQQTIDAFKNDVSAAMPVGTSEAQRIVQEAVAEYLQQRTQEQANQMSQLRESVKKRIIDALRGGS